MKWNNNNKIMKWKIMKIIENNEKIMKIWKWKIMKRK